jgi:hypothetical protein
MDEEENWTKINNLLYDEEFKFENPLFENKDIDFEEEQIITKENDFMNHFFPLGYSKEKEVIYFI